MAQDFCHIPVLPREVTDFLVFPPGKPTRLIDGTVGGGSHSALLLERNPQLEVLGIDRDEDALCAAEKKLDFARDRVYLRRGNYSSMFDFADELDWEKVDGILLDIGVSSPQLDKPERGFSWRFDGPLDMRMDNRSEVTAARLLNRASEDELGRIFSEYGEFKGARRLAREIVTRRGSEPFGSTADLVKICDETLGRSRPGKLPAPTLVFQALRIAVNDELGELKKTLGAALPRLNRGGRIAVISFHSLEDRIVKEFFRRESTECLCPPGLPVCRCGHHAQLAILTKKPVEADETERRENPRSNCAKMRVAEKISA
ncbi:MAG: 16S rRNA (cytosine(1402)-N(4))-methyltransferase RsmH [Victivallaceae bacterium]|nr:16S rRNA (cytosine(1402)-N(4))-methyltransferase RsmH [Victivallaceae bacterium]